MIKFEIKNRFSREVQFTAEIEANDEASESTKKGLAVLWVLKAMANLRGANLHEADLYGANLHEADLRGADLYGANLREADLREADLYGANLRGANLYGANLYGANLRGANLRGAKWTDTIILKQTPIHIQIPNYWAIWILDNHMQIGCELHTFAAWESFDDRCIERMSGEANEFWQIYKPTLIAMCRTRHTKKTD